MDESNDNKAETMRYTNKFSDSGDAFAICLIVILMVVAFYYCAHFFVWRRISAGLICLLVGVVLFLSLCLPKCFGIVAYLGVEKYRLWCAIIHTLMIVLICIPMLVPYIKSKKAIDKGLELVRQQEYKAACDALESVIDSDGILEYKYPLYFDLINYSIGMVYYENGDYYSSLCELDDVNVQSLPKDLQEQYYTNIESIKAEKITLDEEERRRNKEEREEYLAWLKTTEPYNGMSESDIENTSFGNYAGIKLDGQYYPTARYYFEFSATKGFYAYAYEGEIIKTEYIDVKNPVYDWSSGKPQKKKVNGSWEEEWAKIEREEREKWGPIVKEYNDFDDFYDDYYDDFIDYDEAWDTYYDNGGF